MNHEIMWFSLKYSILFIFTKNMLNTYISNIELVPIAQKLVVDFLREKVIMITIVPLSAGVLNAFLWALLESGQPLEPVGRPRPVFSVPYSYYCHRAFLFRDGKPSADQSVHIVITNPSLVICASHECLW